MTSQVQGPEVSLKTVGSNTKKLRMAANSLAAKLAEYKGVPDIRNTIELTKMR